MDAKLRHVGVMCKNLQESMRFYQQFGFQKMSQRVAMEEWAGKKLKILKMRDQGSGILELIEGNWHPHIAITVAKSVDEIWLDYAMRADVILECQKQKDLTVIYMKDPSGNYVEVVCER